MGPYAGVDFNFTLSPLTSRLQHIYHGQLYARVDLNPTPESTLTLYQSRLYPQVRDFVFGLCLSECKVDVCCFDLGLPAVLIPQLGEETDPNLRLDFSEASWIGTYTAPELLIHTFLPGNLNNA
jgi:hypothetical protein